MLVGQHIIVYSPANSHTVRLSDEAHPYHGRSSCPCLHTLTDSHLTAMTPEHCKACARRRLDVITKQLCAGDVGPSTSCSTAPFTRQPTAAAAAAGVQGPRGRDHPSPGSQQPRQQQPLFKGRVVVITGAGKGIGEAAALMFAAQGACLVLADLDAAAAEDVAGRARAAGAEAVSVGGDVTDPAVPGRIVQAAMDHFGALHVLVNNGERHHMHVRVQFRDPKAACCACRGHVRYSW